MHRYCVSCREKNSYGYKTHTATFRRWCKALALSVHRPILHEPTSRSSRGRSCRRLLRRRGTLRRIHGRRGVWCPRGGACGRRLWARDAGHLPAGRGHPVGPGDRALCGAQHAQGAPPWRSALCTPMQLSCWSDRDISDGAQLPSQGMSLMSNREQLIACYDPIQLMPLCTFSVRLDAARPVQLCKGLVGLASRTYRAHVRSQGITDMSNRVVNGFKHVSKL